MATSTKATPTEHRPGSRKGEVHKVYLDKGRDMAHAFGIKQGLKDSSLRSWFSAWKQEEGGKGKAAKKAAVPVKKPEPAKKTAKVIPMSSAKKKVKKEVKKD